MITVIMPAYNVEKYIEASIKSVLNQTYADFELIIVNDGSTDETKNIILKAITLDKRIKFIDSINRGVSYARNIGIEEALGDYITFLDSDDLWEPDFLEKVYEKILTENCIFVHTRFDFIEYDGGHRTYDISCEIGELDDFTNERKGFKFPFHISAVLIKRDFLNQYKIRFEEDRTMFEDSEFFLKILVLEKTYGIPKILMHYRQRMESAIHQKWSVERYFQEFLVYDNIEKNFLDKYHLNKEKFIKTVNYRKYRFVWELIKRNYIIEALDLIDYWKDDLKNFMRANAKLNDKIKCYFFLLKNKKILYYLKKIK